MTKTVQVHSPSTSARFMNDCSTLNITQTFTRYDNPKGNADSERWAGDEAANKGGHPLAASESR